MKNITRRAVRLALNQNKITKSIKDIIIKIIETKESYLNQDVLMLIKHYKNLLLESGIMEDEKLKNLCQKIYDNHKEAIDLINKMADFRGVQKIIADYLTNILIEKGFNRVKGDGNRNIYFIPSKMAHDKGFRFHIYNTGGVSDKYELYIDLDIDDACPCPYDISKCCNLSGSGNKRLGTILSKNPLKDICSYIDENNCIDEEIEKKVKLKENFEKLLNGIDKETIKKL